MFIEASSMHRHWAALLSLLAMYQSCQDQIHIHNNQRDSRDNKHHARTCQVLSTEQDESTTHGLNCHADSAIINPQYPLLTARKRGR